MEKEREKRRKGGEEERREERRKEKGERNLTLLGCWYNEQSLASVRTPIK